LGFKREFLDSEVEIAPPRALIADEEERIKKIVEDKAWVAMWLMSELLRSHVVKSF